MINTVGLDSKRSVELRKNSSSNSLISKTSSLEIDQENANYLSQLKEIYQINPLYLMYSPSIH